MVAGRFRILRTLGSGASAVTYLAEDLRDGGRAAVKVLSLSEASSWKAVDLFQREAEALKAIRIPGVPAYKDFFTEEAEGMVRFILAREYVEGESLLHKAAQGLRADEAEICRIGAAILRITSTLHSLRPPVIHRDINPANVILQKDGGVFLVDFGGVQDAVRSSASEGGTMVGTAGYAPLEQFMGRATIRSDLFGAASTLLFLLTHRNPADLPARNMKTDLSGLVSSPGLAAVLDSYLEPDEARRTLPEEEAIALLEGRAAPPATSGAVPAPLPAASHLELPRGSKILKADGPDGFSLLVPERGKGAAAAATGVFSLFWLGFVCFWTVSAIGMGAPIFFPLFSLPFWGAGAFLVYRSLFGLFGRTHIRIDRQELTVTRSLFFFRMQRRFRLEDVGECRIEERRGRNGTSDSCLLEAGTHSYRFGVMLSEKERLWLLSEINRAMASARAGKERDEKDVVI